MRKGHFLESFYSRRYIPIHQTPSEVRRGVRRGQTKLLTLGRENF